MGRITLRRRVRKSEDRRRRLTIKLGLLVKARAVIKIAIEVVLRLLGGLEEPHRELTVTARVWIMIGVKRPLGHLLKKGAVTTEHLAGARALVGSRGPSVRGAGGKTPA